MTTRDTTGQTESCAPTLGQCELIDKLYAESLRLTNKLVLIVVEEHHLMEAPEKKQVERRRLTDLIQMISKLITLLRGYDDRPLSFTEEEVYDIHKQGSMK